MTKWEPRSLTAAMLLRCSSITSMTTVFRYTNRFFWFGKNYVTPCIMINHKLCKEEKITKTWIMLRFGSYNSKKSKESGSTCGNIENTCINDKRNLGGMSHQTQLLENEITQRNILRKSKASMPLYNIRAIDYEFFWQICFRDEMMVLPALKKVQRTHKANCVPPHFIFRCSKIILWKKMVAESINSNTNFYSNISNCNLERYL